MLGWLHDIFPPAEAIFCQLFPNVPIAFWSVSSWSLRSPREVLQQKKNMWPIVLRVLAKLRAFLWRAPPAWVTPCNSTFLGGPIGRSDVPPVAAPISKVTWPRTRATPKTRTTARLTELSRDVRFEDNDQTLASGSRENVDFLSPGSGGSTAHEPSVDIMGIAFSSVFGRISSLFSRQSEVRILMLGLGLPFLIWTKSVIWTIKVCF